LAGAEITPQAVIAFWREAGRKAWFARNGAFDAAILDGFAAACEDAAAGRLDDWTATAEGALALLLLLDQFPRNLWRGDRRAFAADPLARRVARDAVARGLDQAAALDLRLFFYLPLTHSEDLEDQELGLSLTEALERAGGETAASARRHRDVIARFGRFPHRNAALGRESTAEELAFLAAGGFSA
jgi:uncharacterized protein (DUF924 family)